MTKKVKSFWKWLPPLTFIKVEIKAEGTWANNYVDEGAVEKAMKEALRAKTRSENNVIYLNRRD